MILQTPIIINTPTEPIVQEYLPTPQVSVVGSKDGGLWRTVDNISWKNASITDVMALTYTPEYYQADLDVYFNSFGVDRKFLELPDLRLELCRVSNNSQGGGSASPNNLMGQTFSTKLKSQKDHAATNIVHSASIPIGGNIGDTVTGTKYSGGNGTFDITEWNFPETDYHNGKINRFSNPSLRVALDLRKYFRSSNGSYDTNTIFPIQSGIGSWFQTRNSHGRTQDKSGTKQKFYTRNAVFFFRLSARIGDGEANYTFGFGKYKDGKTATIDLKNGTILNFVGTGDMIGDINTMFSGTGLTYTVNILGVESFEVTIQYNSSIVPTVVSNMTHNENGSIFYPNRIYSDLSIPIYIKPIVRTFYNTAGDINSGSESCIYHYKIGLGNRP